MAEKSFVKIYPQVRFTLEGQIVSVEYFEAYKFYNCFLMAKTGLIAFSTNKKYEVGSNVKIVVATTQYKFNEVV